jgi:putative transposase
MTDGDVITLKMPEQNDPLQEVLREGVRKLLVTAIEAEVSTFIERHGALQADEGKAGVVRNGYLPKRSIQTGLGDIEVKVPKVRDRSGSGIKFNSGMVPPYLKRAQTIEEFLPWLYLRGISTGDFSETLKHLLGSEVLGLSAVTTCRLKQDWEQDHQDWTRGDLSKKRHAYVWTDGVYSNVRQDDRLCLLVIVGSDENGRKELLALADGYRESAAGWEEALTDLRQHDFKTVPKPAVGDGTLGFWKAVAKLWQQTDQQHCCMHKTANVLEKLPKAGTAQGQRSAT